MSSSPISFKVIYNGEARRFRLPEHPSWLEFLRVLDKQIFNSSDDYHEELSLQYINSKGEKDHITSESEWDNLLLLNGDNVLRLEIVEGSGVYFKDSPPPLSLFFYSTEPTIYKTQIQYPNDNRWCPFSQLSISADGKQIILGTNEIKNVTVTKLDNSTNIYWSLEDNKSCGNINIEYSPQKQFIGTLQYKNDEETRFRGEALPQNNNPSKEKQNELSIVTPECLSAFFPSGKILPNHMPDCLKDCVTLIPQGNDMDLDVNLDKLYVISHNKGLEYIENKDYEKAEIFLLNAAKLNSSSAVVQYNLGCCYALWNKQEKSLEHLRNALDLGYTDGEEMAKDEDLSSLLINTEFWNLVELMNTRKNQPN